MKIFVEGGGKTDSAALRISCRKSFGVFLRKVLAQRPNCRLKIEIVVAGSRGEAFNKFCAALAGGDQEVLLLVDSEDVISNLNATTLQTLDPWQHLNSGTNPLPSRPRSVTNDHAQLMGVTMETWLVADTNTLASYYGRGFAANRLPRHAQLEQVPKQQLNNGLEAATSATGKGAYTKGGKHDHSFDLLEKLDPVPIEAKLPHAKRLFDYLRSKC
jgi:hypothetical protein